MQLEPVDAGSNFDAEGARTLQNFTFGFDVPARFHQRSRDARQLGWNQVPTRLRSPAHKPQPEFSEKLSGGVLRGRITAQKAALLGIIEPLRRLILVYQASLIIKRDYALYKSGGGAR